jgi:serine/threonine-protein kinase
MMRPLAMGSQRNIETLVVRNGDGPFDRSMAIPIATQIGSYRVLDLLGDGAIGRVYLAEHIKLGKKVAIKMLRSEYLAHPNVVKRFFAEARAVSTLAHENIVSITDFFEDENGKSYYVMEHLEGLTLLDTLEEQRPMPVARVLPIAKQIAGALQAAHTANIVHRDLKPENVFLVERGGKRDFVKLLDFGVAKLLRGGQLSADETAVGTIVGSPPYMAPEQTMGMNVDHRADIYSFGVLLYELVTGVNPFTANTIEESIIRQRELMPAAPEVDRALSRLIMRCLSKSPDERPGSMHEITAELEIIEARPKVRSRNLIIAASVLAVIAFAVAALAVPKDRAEQKIIFVPTRPPVERTEPEPVVEKMVEEAPPVVKAEEPVRKKKVKRRVKRAQPSKDAQKPPVMVEVEEEVEVDASEIDPTEQKNPFGK